MTKTRAERPARRRLIGGPPARTVVVMAKAPVMGRVKTRLACDIGTVDATWWYRHQTRRLLRRIAADRRWRVLLSVTPDAAVGARFWPGATTRIGQGRGALGRRMIGAMHAVEPGPVVVVGTDIPALDGTALSAAFSALGTARFVIGPAGDGGYWLIGARRGGDLPLGALDEVRWSGPHAMADTVARLERLGPVATGPLLRDVDTGADLEGLHSGSDRA